MASAEASTAPLAADWEERRQTILIADDEEAIRRMLDAQLAARGYLTIEAGTGVRVLEAVSALRPNVVLLDLGLPDIDGIEVTRRLRATSGIPIIILSVRSTESEKIAALDAGADDYLTKPCRIPDLIERLRAAYFRANFDGAFFEVGDLTVDLDRCVVRIDGQRIALTDKEYELLKALVLNAGRLMTERRLANQAWGPRGSHDNSLLLRTAIRTLRQKLHPHPARPRHIAMDPGVGYRLRTEL